ncbi:MAG: hypothetical protein KDC72_08000, partial [Bacteroidetes bacterium]|nr:hypothetical protein [Bacteroidota bacterium]
MKFLKILAIFFFAVGIFNTCKNNKVDTTKTEALTDEAFQTKLQEQLILAEDGDTIEIPEGKYSFTKTLSLEG